MELVTVARRYWSCRKCKHRNERTSSRKCAGCGGLTKPKSRVPKHAQTLRDDSYELYVEVARVLHGVSDESCCVCGRPKHDAARHHRDHDHVTGKPRGLACFQCNSLMPRLLTLERARLVVAYLERAARFDVEFEEAA
jgi:hypothetical protein